MKTFRSKPKFIAKPSARVQAMAKKYGTLGIVKQEGEVLGDELITTQDFSDPLYQKTALTVLLDELTSTAASNELRWTDTSVSATEHYKMVFEVKSVDAVVCRYAVYDGSNYSYIIPITGVDGFNASSYTTVISYFDIPSGCSNIRLYIIKNLTDASSTLLQNVSLRQVL